MSNDRSFNIRSSGESESMSSSIAIEAQRIVKDAASPIPAGETIKGQLRRAARALGYQDGDWRVRAAWYGEASTWSAASFEQLRARYGLWRERQAARADAKGQKLAAVYTALATRLEATDGEFHRNDINALLALARRLGSDDPGKVK